MWTMSVLCFFFCALALASAEQKKTDDGGKLILTPYIEAGDLEEARSLSQVTPLAGDVKSYSGFFTVNKTCDSNIFFWYFPAESEDPDAPLVIWLQGGPGLSSLMGLFTELGPYELTQDNKPRLREYSWGRNYSLIFFDNPVGAGYSYTGDYACYATNEYTVGGNLLTALKQLLTLFPEEAEKPLFVAGESYAGKYVPALCFAIHTDEDPKQKINLHGFAIGNGVVDPINQLLHYELLYQIGLIDFNVRDEMKKMEDGCKYLIEVEDWLEAFDCFDQLIYGIRSPVTYFNRVTGFKYYLNFLQPSGTRQGNWPMFVTSDKVRKMIHVGNATFSDGKVAQDFLMIDILQSVIPWLVELVEEYRVLLYAGQLDIMLAYPLMEAYLQKMDWSAAAEYRKAKRHIWRVDGEIAGYAKTAGKLTEVLIRNAGHKVALDQPKWTYDMISRFIENKPFF